MMSNEWFFDNPREAQRKERLKEEAQRNLQEHLKAKEASLRSKQSTDTIAPVKANPLIGIGEKESSRINSSNVHRSIEREPISQVAQEETKFKSKRFDEYKASELFDHRNNWFSEDDRFFLRRLRAALEREGSFDSFDRHKVSYYPRDYPTNTRQEDEYSDRYRNYSQRPDIEQPSRPFDKLMDYPDYEGRNRENQGQLNKQQQYQRDLDEQVRIKQERRQAERKKLMEEERAKEIELSSYDPYSKNQREHLSKFVPPPTNQMSNASLNYQDPYYQKSVMYAQPQIQPNYFYPPNPYYQFPVVSPSGDNQITRMDPGPDHPYSLMNKPYPPSSIQQPSQEVKPDMRPNEAQEKSHLRGVVDMNTLPQWKKEELLQKQKQLQLNQDNLRLQIQERQRQKALQEQQLKEQEMQDEMRLQKERQELEEKYRRDKEAEAELKSAENNKKNQKEMNEPSEEMLQGTKSNEADGQKGKTAQEIAMEKFLEAQKEAEKLKKEKFKAKREMVQSERPSISEERKIRSSSPPIPALLKKKNVVQNDIEKESEFVVGKNVKEYRETTSRTESASDKKTNEMLDQLRILKNELEKERKMIKEETKVNNQLDFSGLSSDELLHEEKEDGFSGKKSRLQFKQVPTNQLASSSIYLPLKDTKIPSRGNDITRSSKPKEIMRKQSYADTIDLEVYERLNDARLKRLNEVTSIEDF